MNKWKRLYEFERDAMDRECGRLRHLVEAAERAAWRPVSLLREPRGFRRCGVMSTDNGVVDGSQEARRLPVTKPCEPRPLDTRDD